MKRILLRAKKGPFEVVSPLETLNLNLIGNNSGNLIFSHAAHKILATPRTEVVANGFRADPYEADRINDEFDAFVVPLANAFRKSFVDQLRDLTRLIERLRIPVVVLGVGAQSNINYDMSVLKPYEDGVRAFVRAVLDRSPSIGVRGEFTAEFLRGLGFSDVEVIGCPSMFLHGEALKVEKKVPALDRNSQIAINISPYVKSAGPIVMSHFRKYPNLVYIAQDLQMLETLLLGDDPADAGKISAIPRYSSHPLYRENKIRFFVDPWPWFAYLAERDFSFGTRIHGNIASLVAGTPAFVFAHDSRTRELAEYFEIPYRRMVDVPPDVDVTELYESADYSGLNDRHPQRFETFKGFLGRHGLDHSFAGDAGNVAFDDELKNISFPPPVESLAGASPDEVMARMAWLRERHGKLRAKFEQQEGHPLVVWGRRWQRIRSAAGYYSRWPWRSGRGHAGYAVIATAMVWLGG